MVALMAFWQMYTLNGVLDAIRCAAFNCISVMTGTGCATTDYGAWGGFAMSTMFARLLLVAVRDRRPVASKSSVFKCCAPPQELRSSDCSPRMASLSPTITASRSQNPSQKR